jgi:hypothetical protein
MWNIKLLVFGSVSDKNTSPCFFLIAIMRTCFVTFSEGTGLSAALPFLVHLCISLPFKSGQSIRQLSRGFLDKRLMWFW